MVLISLDRNEQVLSIRGERPVKVLSDGLTTVNWFNSDFSNSFLVLPNLVRLDLRGDYDDVWIRYYNKFAGGVAQPSFELFNDDRTDSLTVSAGVLIDQWVYVDTTVTKAAPFYVRWIDVTFTAFSETTEIEVKGVYQNAVTSIFQTGVSSPSDPGAKYWQGIGVLGDEDTATMLNAGSYRITQRDWWSSDDKTESFGSLSYKLNRFRDEATLLQTLKNRGFRGGRYSNGSPAASRPAYIPASPTYNDFANALDANKAIIAGSDSTKVEEWRKHTKPYWEGTAAIFGNDATATLPGGHTYSGTTLTTGRNLMYWGEVGQEDNKNWKGDTGYHSTDVTLVKMRAAWEGVKNADSAFPVYTGATTMFDSLRIKGLMAQSYIWYGKGNLPFDGVFINQYITDAYGPQPQGFNTNSGISPERFNLRNWCKEVVRIRNKWIPGKKVVLSETSFATSSSSNYNVPTIAGQTARETQANWYLRVLEIASIAETSNGNVGIDGIFNYWMKDDGTNDFGSMNNITPNFDGGGVYIGFTAHEIWYYTATRMQRHQNFRAWATVITDGDSTGVWVTRKNHTTASDSVIYAVWRGTSDGTTTSSYVLNVGFGIAATMITPVTGDMDGVTSTLTITSNSVTIPSVTEKPVYVVVKTADLPPTFYPIKRRVTYGN